MAYSYCSRSSCQAELWPPTMREAIAGEYECPSCGQMNTTHTTAGEVLGDFIERFEAMEKEVAELRETVSRLDF